MSVILNKEHFETKTNVEMPKITNKSGDAPDKIIRSKNTENIVLPSGE